RPSSPSSTGGRRSRSRTTQAAAGTKRAAACLQAVRSQSPRTIRTGSPTRPSIASTSRRTEAGSGVRSSRNCRRSRASAGWKPELAARDDHGGAANLDALHLLRRPVGAREELRGPTDLGSLRDLDLIAEVDAAIARQVQRERPGGGTCGGILRNAARRREHSRLPAGAGAREAIHADHVRQIRKSVEIGPQPGDFVLRTKTDIDVRDTIVVELNRQLGPFHPYGREQLGLSVVRPHGRQRLLHAPEDDPVLVPL